MKTNVKTLVEEETEHRQQVRQVIYGIMHEVLFMDTSTMADLAEVRATVHSFATKTYGEDVARIAADRVIDCLMWL